MLRIRYIRFANSIYLLRKCELNTIMQPAVDDIHTLCDDIQTLRFDDIHAYGVIATKSLPCEHSEPLTPVPCSLSPVPCIRKTDTMCRLFSYAYIMFALVLTKCITFDEIRLPSKWKRGVCFFASSTVTPRSFAIAL